MLGKGTNQDVFHFLAKGAPIIFCWACHESFRLWWHDLDAGRHRLSLQWMHLFDQLIYCLFNYLTFTAISYSTGLFDLHWRFWSSDLLNDLRSWWLSLNNVLCRNNFVTTSNLFGRLFNFRFNSLLYDFSLSVYRGLFYSNDRLDWFNICNHLINLFKRLINLCNKLVNDIDFICLLSDEEIRVYWLCRN